jgi:hypothetical protein
MFMDRRAFGLIAISGSWLPLITPAKTSSTGKDWLTEIPTLSPTSQQLDQLTFEKQGRNQKARTPLRKEI